MMTHSAAPDVPFEVIFPEMHVRWKRRGYNQIKTNYVRIITQAEYLFLANDQHSSKTTGNTGDSALTLTGYKQASEIDSSIISLSV